MAYAVAQRTSEIGIRMALGASRLDVHGMVLRGALVQTGAGLLIGIPAALVAGRLMESQLYGVAAYNPMVTGVTTAVLGAVALPAAALPAGGPRAWSPWKPCVRSERGTAKGRAGATSCSHQACPTQDQVVVHHRVVDSIRARERDRNATYAQ
ncbi:MAG TPA: FtsX-like permease family protein [Terriglobia bacterium]|nr:FtsX-like permease family protein [Terriglobia bacterium]